jgi:hypothetical protein
MNSTTHYLAAAAAFGGLSAPVAAQYAPYPGQPVTTYPGYPAQTYPGYAQPGYPQTGYPQTGYGQPGYGYNQGYSQNPVQQIIDGLLGNRYTVTDRQAVSQCASAAMTQAQAQYRGYNAYGGNQGYAGQHGFAAPAMRVTSITDVQRRKSGLRVKGLLGSGYAGQYGQYGQQNRNYAQGDLSFRCNVDYRGAVTDIRIGRNEAYRRY